MWGVSHLLVKQFLRDGIRTMRIIHVTDLTYFTLKVCYFLFRRIVESAQIGALNEMLITFSILNTSSAQLRIPCISCFALKHSFEKLIYTVM